VSDYVAVSVPKQGRVFFICLFINLKFFGRLRIKIVLFSIGYGTHVPIRIISVDGDASSDSAVKYSGKLKISQGFYEVGGEHKQGV
jgi:hypothetical protein